MSHFACESLIRQFIFRFGIKPYSTDQRTLKNSHRSNTLSIHCNNSTQVVEPCEYLTQLEQILQEHGIYIEVVDEKEGAHSSSRFRGIGWWGRCDNGHLLAGFQNRCDLITLNQKWQPVEELEILKKLRKQ